MVKKVVTVISGIESSLGMESYLKGLSKTKYENTVVLLHSVQGSIAAVLEKEGLEVVWIPYRGKKDLLSAFRSLVRIMKRIQPDIIHTHLFEGSLIGIHAARFCGIKKRITTRHHSTFHHTYHPGAVKYDRWVNNSSTHIVSISETVSKVLVEREQVNPEKIHLIHHGFDFGLASQLSDTDHILPKSKYSLLQDDILIGVISRSTEWKGLQYIIEGFHALHKKHPKAVLLLGNLQGEYLDHLILLLKKLPENSYRILEHESNPALLYRLFDFFVHAPIDNHSEAFGQVYVEALAAGKPCVFTLSGIGNSLCENEVNCLVVKYRDAHSISQALEKLITDPSLRERLSKAGPLSVRGKFELSEMIRKLEELYDR